ncbi:MULTISPECIES: uridine kinase [Basfia]|uniref:Uridine kinase n=2 Tax=Basfia TaxID=697331 RepID=URK_MANSM|nr:MULTISPECIES: uridine kinase [Basfia]Q65S71.1 RecName: Full=Uridine kinase; AltName: Full=Cytidine monophosphokinase; AltName: Full=Uridine monophosphokinase [[Mannheimia] succiniciproducens MBEL55E]AAU38189.1 Udk protein [[Mannheimia] succiniciproducens MBEL55E]QIM68858.1 uridine kinase [Basfia succiniciproducens]SCY03304.1 uridine kinase [Basfia succiniciproducens]
MSDSANSSCIIIAIAGASASGKSLIASTVHRELRDQVGSDDISIISEDCYYKDQSHLDFATRTQTNYDHPNSMDRDLLLEHLRALKAGKSVDIPQYSYVEHTRMKEVTHFTPKKVIILEGILLLTDERVRNELSLSLFVDAPLDICFIRRLKRDMEERGRSLESVIEQYRKTVRPMFLQFIEPSKQYADIIIPRGGKNRIAINMLKAQILHLLGRK